MRGPRRECQQAFEESGTNPKALEEFIRIGPKYKQRESIASSLTPEFMVIIDKDLEETARRLRTVRGSSSRRSQIYIGTLSRPDMTQQKALEVGNTRKVKALLKVLSNAVPYEVDVQKLSKSIGIERGTVLKYCKRSLLRLGL